MVIVRIKQKDVINIHKNKPAFILGHGPSLSSALPVMKKMQEKEDLILFALNDWYKLYDIGNKSPDYWLFASNIDTVHAHQTPIQQHKSTVLFADTVDLVRYEEMDKFENLNYLPYDQRHFKGHSCTQIWYNFYNHYRKNENNDFTHYGNNKVMFAPSGAPNAASQGWNTYDPAVRWFHPETITPYQWNACCSRIKDANIVNDEVKKYMDSRLGYFQEEITDWEPAGNARLTIQEELQGVSNYTEHYSPGDTVILHAIAFAIIMGCNPIYVAGMDLDYANGYVNGNESPTDDVWQKQDVNLINDIRILNESAKNINVNIINMKPDAWYGQFMSYNDQDKK